MSAKILVLILGISLTILTMVYLVQHTGIYPINEEPHQEKTLTFSNCEDETLATLDVDVSETARQTYIGLSDKETLEDSRGMLFVYLDEDERRFVMRNMKFSLDIIFVGEDGKIQDIKTGEKPANPVEYYLTYDSVEGYGKYVVESNIGWTQSEGISEGDCVEELRN